VNDRKPDISVLLPDDATVTARRDALTAAVRTGEPHGRRGSRRLRRYRLVAVAATIAIVLVACGFFAFEKDDGAPSVQPAFADAAVRVAEANPRLLVTASGWSVKHAYGFEVDSGSMIFGNGTHHLTIDWYPATSAIVARSAQLSTPRSSATGRRRSATTGAPSTNPAWITRRFFPPGVPWQLGCAASFPASANTRRF
jgi:hypothetical protein